MSEFERLYKGAYRKAYNYHERHYGAKAEEDWKAAADDLKKTFVTPLEIRMGILVYAMLEDEVKL